MSGSEVGRASSSIRDIEQQRPTPNTIQRTGSDMHRHALTVMTTDYESAALPTELLAQVPESSTTYTDDGGTESAAVGQEWAMRGAA